MSQINDTAAAADRLAAWHLWRGRIYRGYAAGVGFAIVAAFFESFHNLIAWFEHNGFRGLYAFVAPAMIDVFILGGESLLLVAVLERWDWKAKAAGWISTVIGLAASVAGNIGAADMTPAARTVRAAAAAGLPLKQMISFAAAPLALGGLTALGLMIVKRHLRIDDVPGRTPELPEDLITAVLWFGADVQQGQVPPIRAIRARVSCGQPAAQRIQAYLTQLAAAYRGPGGGVSGRDEVA